MFECTAVKALLAYMSLRIYLQVHFDYQACWTNLAQESPPGNGFNHARGAIH